MIRFTQIARSRGHRSEGLDLLECLVLAVWVSVSAVTTAADLAEIRSMEGRPAEVRPTEDRLVAVWPTPRHCVDD